VLQFPVDAPGYLLHLLGLVVTAGVSIAVARWVSRQSDEGAARTMVLLLRIHATMAALVAVQLLVSSAAVEELLVGTWHGLFPATAPVWLAFAIYYTGRDHWMTARVRLVLWLGGVVPFVLSVTDPVHGLMFTDWTVQTEPFTFRYAAVTPLNESFLVLTTLGILTGFALLIRLSVFSRRSSRWQSVALLAGLPVILLLAMLAYTPFAPVRNFPYGIFGSGVFGVLVAGSLYRTRLFAVAPLARDSLFDSVDDAVIVVNTDRRLVDYNARALALFPSLDGRIGRPLDDVCPVLVGSADWTPDASDHGVGESISPFVGAVRRSVDGETRSFNVTTSEISRGGRRYGYGLIVSDVTTLVEYSTELERKTERLEQFASVLSHDLRNPVSVAMGRIELEREDGDSEHLRKSREALDRIDTTIDDLLRLARNGDAVSDSAPVSLRGVAADAWETSDTGDATLSVEVDDQYRVLADRSRLRTLLENLFRNAADHGGHRVTVGRVGAGANVGPGSGFFVADDGPGIPEDERDAVFEYGYSTVDEGTGFGLAIVQSIADAHDWSLAITESSDSGARFEVTGVATSEADVGSTTEPAA